MADVRGRWRLAGVLALLGLLVGGAAVLALTPGADALRSADASVASADPSPAIADTDRSSRRVLPARKRADTRARPSRDAVVREIQQEAKRDAQAGLDGLSELRKFLEAEERRVAAAARAKRQRVNPHRIVATTHPDGSPFRTGRLKNGEREGLWIERFESGARVETVYVDGERQGREAAWHPDGKPRFLGEYRRGRMHGVWTAWHPTGAVLSTREYVDDKLHGPMRTFHESGTLAEESFYEDGLETGVNRGWHVTGQLAWEMIYVDGKREGTAIWFDDQGKLFAEGTYVEDGLHGTYVEYAPDGSVKRTERWDRGRRVELEAENHDESLE